MDVEELILGVIINYIFRFDLANALLVFTSSVITASMASFCLGIIMIGVIIGIFKFTFFKKESGVCTY